MSHTTQIITHLKEHGSITGLQALRHYDCMRLSARIFDIRNMGYVIDAQKWKTRSGKTVSRYWLLKSPELREQPGPRENRGGSA